MPRANDIKKQILTVCEAISIEEIDSAYKWLNELMISAGYQISNVEAYDNGSSDVSGTIKSPDFTLTYRNLRAPFSILPSFDETVTLSCNSKSKPSLTVSLSFSGSSEKETSTDYASLYVGGESWDTPEEAQEQLLGWIEQIKASSIYQDMITRLTGEEGTSDTTYDYDTVQDDDNDAQGQEYEDDQYDQDISEPIWF
jgi:hypothetical protein